MEDADSQAPRHETETERLDRNLEELLAGLRVALPGVQVLFAFLLILPFQSRFELVTDFEKGVFYVTLALTALALVLLIAPPVRHRLRFRKHDKAYLIESSNRLAIAGFAVLACAVVGAMVLVSNFLFGAVAAVPTGIGLALALSWIWFGSPLRRGE